LSYVKLVGYPPTQKNKLLAFLFSNSAATVFTLQGTWDYNTDSLQPNHSKGDIVFMGVFANVYIGNKFSGTLEIKSNIILLLMMPCIC
jgi:hypothetical protein